MFDIKPQYVKTGLNGLAKFECAASGNPQPSIYWTKEGSQELMFPDNTYDRHHVTLEGTLEIKSVRKEDAGYYVCSAFSVAGSGTTRAFLEVSKSVIKGFLLLAPVSIVAQYLWLICAESVNFPHSLRPIHVLLVYIQICFFMLNTCCFTFS